MQAPLQRIQKQNPIYGQQANVPAAMPIWTAPIHANRFPTTGVQTVQVPAMAYPQPSKLQSAAPAQSILTNRPSGMPLNQPNTQQSQSTPNKKEVHPDNFDGTGKQNVWLPGTFWAMRQMESVVRRTESTNVKYPSLGRSSVVTKWLSSGTTWKLRCDKAIDFWQVWAKAKRCDVPMSV